MSYRYTAVYRKTRQVGVYSIRCTAPRHTFVRRRFSIRRAGRCFARSAKEYQHRQTLLDVVKKMFHACRNKDDRTWTNFEPLGHAIGVVYYHFRPTARDVVNLVFRMRGLWVLGASFQHVNPETQRPRLHKLQISFLRLRQQLREVKDIRVHGGTSTRQHDFPRRASIRQLLFTG